MILIGAGFKLDQPAFYAMVKAFDPDRNAQLAMSEFIAMTLFLQVCRSVGPPVSLSLLSGAGAALHHRREHQSPYSP
jgi:hypothetical protein